MSGDPPDNPYRPPTDVDTDDADVFTPTAERNIVGEIARALSTIVGITTGWIVIGVANSLAIAIAGAMLIVCSCLIGLGARAKRRRG